MSNERRYRDHSREPMPTGSTPQDHLIFLRDTFSDAIPDELIHSHYWDNRYKVRKNWWFGLTATLENIQHLGEFGAADPGQVQTFVDDYLSDEFRARHVTKQDIQRATRLINEVVLFEESDPMLWTADKPFHLKFV